MPKYQVERSIHIDLSKEKIIHSLKNYKEWSHWSPWLIMDKYVQVEYSENQGEVGSYYIWEGELIGSGTMTLISVEQSRIEMQIQFVKPFKSIAKVEFLLTEKEKTTEVTWKMFNSLPFFLFFMTKQMQTFTGMDYERGLKMLKEYLETNSVHSKVELNGLYKVMGQRYIGIKRTTTFEELSDTMQKDFQTLQKFIEKYNIQLKTVPFSIYNNFDIVNRQSEFISCIPYSGNAPLPKGAIRGDLKSFEGLKVTHTGHYEHVDNAWSTAFNYARTKKITTKKLPIGLEFYLNDPSNTKKEKLIIEVYLPLKKI